MSNNRFRGAIARRASAAAIATAVAGSVLAVAVAPLAQAYDCTKYKFIGDYSIHQSNGFTVQFHSTTRSASGRAVALNSSGITVLTGSVSGGFVNGYALDFTINWDNGSGGHYTGSTNADGFAGGRTQDVAHPASTASWGGTVPLGCASKPTGPRPGPDNTPILADP